jgi:hypothetical protein
LSESRLPATFAWTQGGEPWHSAKTILDSSSNRAAPASEAKARVAATGRRTCPATTAVSKAAGPGGAGQRRQEGVESQPGAEERSGGAQQRQEEASEDGPDADEQARGARATQGNLGTTQREWSNRDNTADSDQE